MPKSIKREPALQPLSREHHHGLLLCWKIREGLKRKVDPDRIKKYTDWFWENNLVPHFKEEEKAVFPVLGNEHNLVKKALSEHRRLKRLFEEDVASLKTLGLIEEELDSHIRFEERVLFNKIQEVATRAQLEAITVHNEKEVTLDEWHDVFWNDVS